MRHILVSTNGYATPQGFVNDATNPLQDAINYTTNFMQLAPDFQIFAPNGLPYITTNYAGATIEFNGIFYKPQRFHHSRLSTLTLRSIFTGRDFYNRP